MNTQKQDVWNTLLAAGLVQEPCPEADNNDPPWSVKTLQAVSRWLAALFLLGFLGFVLTPIYDSIAGLLSAGLLLLGVAYASLRASNNEFSEHLALATSFAGQALIIWVILDISDLLLSWVLAFLLQVVLTLVMPNFVHRVISAFFTAFCFSAVLPLLGAPYVAGSVVMFAAAWLWLHEFDYPKRMQSMRPVAYGLILSLIQFKGSALFAINPVGWSSVDTALNSWIQPWWGQAMAGAVLLYVVYSILKQLGHKFSEPTPLVLMIATVLFVLASAEAHGITFGVLVLLLGFARSNRVLLGLGVVSLLFYISAYYYLLDSTLLEKSQTLLIIGSGSLFIRWLILRVVNNREVQHG